MSSQRKSSKSNDKKTIQKTMKNTCDESYGRGDTGDVQNIVKGPVIQVVKYGFSQGMMHVF